MRNLIALVALAAAACGTPTPTVIPDAVKGTCATPTSTIPSGDVEGTFCGNITAPQSFKVPSGKTLTITKGSVLAMPQGASFEIDGTLITSGTKDAPVTITSTSSWNGIILAGTFTATDTKIDGHDAALFQSSGALNWTDTSLDLHNPGLSPDCMTINGGTQTMDHTHITGCHCPMHIDASDGVTITSSILEGADWMIARAQATMHHSHVLAALDDIGGNFNADVSGNYYGGGSPTVYLTQGDGGAFANSDQFSGTAFNDVGPRF
ncbi:MAG TPA: hypothetical protein VGO62_14010 [Myxococcota bacterium]|jgi:hypothetical protein